MDAPDWRDTFNRKEKRREAAKSEPDIETRTARSSAAITEEGNWRKYVTGSRNNQMSSIAMKPALPKPQ
jgi:hypothetical protein